MEIFKTILGNRFVLTVLGVVVLALVVAFLGIKPDDVLKIFSTLAGFGS